ncbi:aspartic proteinase CDR1-like [Abrus precatorius]|uniref:Aspartic proteinase CDR1-like n=1 Tax=Abrus precatorius TaxID=3816 RepID=A0A8B8LLM3_ABRPR|nr:aspartic proteinase CDR1-like [Abrus precatorius]
MGTMQHYSSLILVLLCLFNTPFMEALNGGFSVEIIHRDSSRSPFYNLTETHFQRVSNAVRRSINRANHLEKSFVSGNTVEATVAPDDGGAYLLNYSIGTPPFQLYGIVDTGSGLVWQQCQPCKRCFNQTTPIFNLSKSNTYKTLPCSSAICKSVKDTFCNPNNDQNCGYYIDYADGSYSQGDISVDTLTFGSINGCVKFPNIVIGCGRKNAVSFEKGKGSGIVGFGGGPVSLISQLSSSIEAKFSYCLVPMLSQSSKLNFGDAAVVSGDGTVSTPIVPQNPKVFYHLTLEALSVQNNRIEFGRSSSKSDSTEGNIIIDSGSTLSVLPDDVYSKLESAVANVVKLERAKDPLKQLNLCYKSRLEKLDAPIITAHFRGADVKLNAINTFLQVDDEIVCLAFFSSPKLAIFGNVAQQNFLVGYDLQKKTVSFKPTDCAKQ